MPVPERMWAYASPNILKQNWSIIKQPKALHYIPVELGLYTSMAIY